MSSSDARDALVDIVNSIRTIFKKYDRPSRKRAWHSLQVGQGKSHIEKIINSPSMPVVGIRTWLTYKEQRIESEKKDS